MTDFQIYNNLPRELQLKINDYIPINYKKTIKKRFKRSTYNKFKEWFELNSYIDFKLIPVEFKCIYACEKNYINYITCHLEFINFNKNLLYHCVCISMNCNNMEIYDKLNYNIFNISDKCLTKFCNKDVLYTLVKTYNKYSNLYYKYSYNKNYLNTTTESQFINSTTITRECKIHLFENNDSWKLKLSSFEEDDLDFYCKYKINKDKSFIDPLYSYYVKYDSIVSKIISYCNNKKISNLFTLSVLRGDENITRKCTNIVPNLTNNLWEYKINNINNYFQYGGKFNFENIINENNINENFIILLIKYFPDDIHKLKVDTESFKFNPEKLEIILKNKNKIKLDVNSLNIQSLLDKRYFEFIRTIKKYYPEFKVEYKFPMKNVSPINTIYKFLKSLDDRTSL